MIHHDLILRSSLSTYDRSSTETTGQHAPSLPDEYGALLFADERAQWEPAWDDFLTDPSDVEEVAPPLPDEEEALAFADGRAQWDPAWDEFLSSLSGNEEVAPPLPDEEEALAYADGSAQWDPAWNEFLYDLSGDEQGRKDRVGDKDMPTYNARPQGERPRSCPKTASEEPGVIEIGTARANPRWLRDLKYRAKHGDGKATKEHLGLQALRRRRQLQCQWQRQKRQERTAAAGSKESKATGSGSSEQRKDSAATMQLEAGRTDQDIETVTADLSSSTVKDEDQRWIDEILQLDLEGVPVRD